MLAAAILPIVLRRPRNDTKDSDSQTQKARQLPHGHYMNTASGCGAFNPTSSIIMVIGHTISPTHVRCRMSDVDVADLRSFEV